LFFAGSSHVHIKIEASPTETELITTDPQQLAALKASANIDENSSAADLFVNYNKELSEIESANQEPSIQEPSIDYDEIVRQKMDSIPVPADIPADQPDQFDQTPTEAPATNTPLIMPDQTVVPTTEIAQPDLGPPMTSAPPPPAPQIQTAQPADDDTSAAVVSSVQEPQANSTPTQQEQPAILELPVTENTAELRIEH
jgi:hypothetical protein